jgi:acetyl esterase/lipase
MFDSINHSSDDRIDIVNRKVGDVNVRIHRSKTGVDEKKPILVYIHGGGYAFINLDAYNLYFIEFVKQLDVIVLSIE